MTSTRLRIAALVVIASGLAGCEGTLGPDADRAMQPLNALDEADLGSIMMNAAAPDEAVSYFQRAATQSPENLDLQRGLATSLVRAQRAHEALPLWRDIVAHPQAGPEDRVDFADALVRTGDWGAAEAQLEAVPPTFETYDRFRLEAMVADSNEDWQRADSYYRSAANLTTQPSNILNNWGYSHLVRGDHAGAEELFLDAVRYDPTLFTAKNNLVIARAAQGNYQLPLVQMTQTERAQLLHTAGLAAIRQGETETGRALLQTALDTHPQYFEAAAQALQTLGGEGLPL